MTELDLHLWYPTLKVGDLVRVDFQNQRYKIQGPHRLIRPIGAFVDPNSTDSPRDAEGDFWIEYDGIEICIRRDIRPMGDA